MDVLLKMYLISEAIVVHLLNRYIYIEREREIYIYIYIYIYLCVCVYIYKCMPLVAQLYNANIS
jgi:hypothetical protein